MSFYKSIRFTLANEANATAHIYFQTHLSIQKHPSTVEVFALMAKPHLRMCDSGIYPALI